MSRLLDLRGVTKGFGGLVCIDRLDLHVDEGEIVSVIGPNGAGKTTLFNLVTGVPVSSAASGSSRIARHARPVRERLTRWTTPSTARKKTSAT